MYWNKQASIELGWTLFRESKGYQTRVQAKTQQRSQTLAQIGPPVWSNSRSINVWDPLHSCAQLGQKDCFIKTRSKNISSSNNVDTNSIIVCILLQKSL